MGTKPSMQDPSRPGRAFALAALALACAQACHGRTSARDPLGADRAEAAVLDAHADARVGRRTVAFPLKASANRRYLVDQHDVPFPIMGRTAWSLIAVPAADAELFLDDTLSRGFDAIELMIPSGHVDTNHPPRNARGELPFVKRLDGLAWNGALEYNRLATEAPDFTTWNEPYWASVDRLLAACEARGLLVLLFPAYVGQDQEQGWMEEITANGGARMQAYGAFVAGRYRRHRNIVWMLGGDMGKFGPRQTAAESGLLAGIESAAGPPPIHFSAEWSGDMNGVEQKPFGASMTLNSAYSWGNVIGASRRAFGQQATMPAFLLEEPYDQEGPDGNSVAKQYATQPVRRYEWWGWLSTIGGYVAGNGYVWPFKTGWKEHLNTPGVRDLARLNAFMQSIPWHTLRPSGMGGATTLITGGLGTFDRPSKDAWNDDYVAAAITADGRLLLAYVPPKHAGPITVDLSAMRGPAQAQWFDPTTASYTAVAGSPFANTGPQEFTPPAGTHADGATDWLLVLRSP